VIDVVKLAEHHALAALIAELFHGFLDALQGAGQAAAALFDDAGLVGANSSMTGRGRIKEISPWRTSSSRAPRMACW
jgi:hypothetical protein